MIDINPKIIYEPAQLDSIRELIEKRVADGTLSVEVIDNRIREFALSARSTEITSRPADLTSSSKIGSAQLSDIIDRLYIDIGTLYKSLDRAENSINFKKKKSDQQYKASFDSYLKVKSDVKSFISGYQNPKYDEIRKITFSDKRNESNLENPAIANGKSNRLMLHGDHVNVASKTKLVATVDFQGNAYTSRGDLASIVDPDPATYWQSVVMLESKADSLTATVDIAMSSAQSFSSIFILPFSPQPLRVSNIQYSVDGISWTPISGFEASLATQNTDYVSFNFPAVVGRFVQIELEQSNYIYRDKFIPVSYEEVTQQVFADRLTQAISLVDFTNYESRSVEVKEDLLKAVIKTATLANQPVSTVSGYEYIFGLSDVSIFDSSYNLTGEFSSPKFVNHKNAFSIEVETIEIQNDATSIEYSIDTGNNKRLPIVPVANEDFVRNEVLDFSGRSFKQFTRFEINVEKGVVVYENGIELDPNNYSFGADYIILLSVTDSFTPSNSNIYTVSYYTISGSQLVLSDQLNSVAVTPEKFTSTSPTGEILLESCPHIEYAIVNDLVNFYYNNGVYVYAGERNTILGFNIESPDEAIQVPADSISSILNVKYLDSKAYGNTEDTNLQYSPIEILIDGIKATNITNYLGGPQKALSSKPFGDTVYEFIQNQNRVTFGTMITGKNIEVRYNSIAKHIQLIAMLRRTSSLDASLTPVVKEATLYIKSRNK